MQTGSLIMRIGKYLIMSKYKDIDLYNEIREKIATAAEIQLLLFLTDDQLDILIDTVYEDILTQRETGVLDEFYFNIENLTTGHLLISMHKNKTFVSAIQQETKITLDVLDSYEILVNDIAKNNQNAKISTKTWIENNRIITEVTEV